jgi:Glycosyltransferase family 87
MNRIDFRRVFVIAGLASLAVVYVALWMRMITDLSERTGSDFIVFFTAGRIAQTDGSVHIYEPELQQDIQQAEVGFPLVPGQVLLYNHVPYLIPILAVVVNGNYVASFIRWVVLLLVLGAGSVSILVGFLWQVGWRRADVWVAAAGMLAFFPFFVSLMNGQDTAFTFLGLCLWLVGLLTGLDWLAGLGLALTSIRPHVTVLLAVPFLFKRRKVFGWFCVGALVLGLVSLLSVGFAGMRGFLDLLLVSAGGGWYGLKEQVMVNLVGLLWRIAPGLGGNSIHMIGWVVYGLTLVGLCVLWVRSREIDERVIGLAVTVSLFASPHLHYHDLALLLLPLVAALLVLVRRGFLHTPNASLVPLAISLLLLFGSLIPGVKYNLPYLIMLLIILLLWVPDKIFRRSVSSGRTT